MKKSYLPGILAISLLMLGFVIFGTSLSLVKAQTEDTSTPTETETPTLTPEPPNLSVKKIYKFSNDVNNNGIIDPGDLITFIVTVENNSPQAANLVLRDQVNWNYFEKRLESNSKNCYITGDLIECTLEQVGSSEVNYTLKIRDPMDFNGQDHLSIRNDVTVLIEETPLATANVEFSVNAPTPTPTPTETVTPTPTLTPIPTATATPQPPPPTSPPPGASALNTKPVSTITIAVLALIGIGVFTYIGGIAKFQAGEDIKAAADLTEVRISMFREGIIIIFIVSAVLLMGIAGTLNSDGVISILSAIVGYVFGRASSRR